MLTVHDSALESHLRRLCDTGRAGDRLPSVRELQRTFAVSPVTVQRVVRVLVMEGRAVARPGDGTFVAHRTAAPPADLDTAWQTVVLGRSPVIPPGLDHLTFPRSATALALDNAFPDTGLQAQQLLAKAAARVCRRPEAWDRCHPQGLPELRAVFAAELGAPFGPDDVLVTPGAQAALDSIFRVLARPGDAVVLEDPGYPGAIVAATLCGLVPTPVPTDRDGVIPEALESVLERSGARLVVLQPRHANPSGACLSAPRRRRVVEIAERFGGFVVEDDWVRDLDLDGPTGPPLLVEDRDGHVISVRSLSKSTAPGLRIAAVVARGPVLARLTSARLAADFFVAPLIQLVAAELLPSSGWQRHLSGLRAALADRRDALSAALAEYAPALECVPPAGGVALWVGLPHGVDDIAFVAACAERGVRLAAGRNYWLSEPASSFVRIAFSSAEPAELVVAAQRIGRALTAAARA